MTGTVKSFRLISPNDDLMHMAKCPKCKKETSKPQATWKYGHFGVEAYLCPSCRTQFRQYATNGKHSFTVLLQNGKYRKA
jgi:transposase-like protein